MKRKQVITIIFSTLLLLQINAIGDGIELPQETILIESEAFAGTTSITEIEIPDAVKEIGDRAFADCEKLGFVRIPAEVTKIGAEAFENCMEDILLYTEHGSFAEMYAIDHLHDYQADTHYRALLIGNTYSDDAIMKLEGPSNDVLAMEECLKQFEQTPYDVSVYMNQTARGMLDCIHSTFTSASSQDVSLFYFSGHGIQTEGETTQGALLGNDTSDSLTAEQLRKTLDSVPGRKIIIIDACYSGYFAISSGLRKLKASQSANVSSENFSQLFISSFTSGRKRGASPDRYFIITSGLEDELSYEEITGGKIMGVFTSNFVSGCGWNTRINTPKDISADANGNDVVTFKEISQYTKTKLSTENQHVQYWPVDSEWFGFLRR